MRNKLVRTLSPAVGFFLALAYLAAPCRAGDIYVTVIADALGLPYCNLRNALVAAYLHRATGACPGATAGYNTIHVPKGVFKITATDSQGNLYPLQRLDNVSIVGAGAKSSGTIIDANGASYLFRVLRDASLIGLEIQGAHGGYGGYGVISVATGARLEIGDCYFHDNSAYAGGAVYFDSGSFGSIYGSWFEYNRADAFGGAIVAAGGASLHMENTTLSHNESLSQGGGIMLGGSTYINQSTIGENRANTNGGGVYVTGGMSLSCRRPWPSIRWARAGTAPAYLLSQGPPRFQEPCSATTKPAELARTAAAPR